MSLKQPSQAKSKIEGTPLGTEKEGASSSVEGKVISQQANKKSRNSGKGEGISQESDSFYKYYNKEIKVNQEEIPIVLYELIDAAYNYIQRESYDKALILLQKTEGVLEVVSLESSRRDRYIAYTCFHNMAMCYQKLNMLEECFIYLKECYAIISAPLPKGQYFYKYSSESCVAARMKQLRQECKLRLQLCAILSQTQNHTEALDNAKKSCKLVHQLFKDLLMLCALYVRKIERKEVNKGVKSGDKLGSKSITDEEDEGEEAKTVIDELPQPKNFLEESISMLERTSMKLYPVVKEVLKRMIDETKNEKQVPVNPDLDPTFEGIDIQRLLTQEDNQTFMLPQGVADMRSVLGFLNQNEWVYSLNIGNIMQLQPVSLKNDLLTQCRNECELSRDSFLEKIALMSVAYFCVSTEMRFILQSREQYLSSPVKRQRELESEYWHAKSLEMACSFLPSECPLLNHILLSYQKHHDPSQQPIKEDQEQNDVLTVIRPLPGIESNKYQPIIRQITNIKVSLTPCQISPITKRIFNSSHVQQPKILANQANQVDQDPAIAMCDQQEQQLPAFTNQEMQTSLELNLNKSENKPLVPHLQQSQPHELLSLYSDDYYDQFVRKIFDENPMLDKKTLVTKLLCHLQIQDYSFLQRQINEQSLLDDEFDDLLKGQNAQQLKQELQGIHAKRDYDKEQRRTLLNFEEQSLSDHSDAEMVRNELLSQEEDDDEPIRAEDILLVPSKRGHQLLVSGLGMSYENDLDQEIDRDLAKQVRTTQDISRQSFSQKQPHVWSQQNRLPIVGSGNVQSVSSSGSSQQYHQLKKRTVQNPSSQDIKKKRDSGRVQKLMSCLEGDSLLKEIERSLEQHTKMEEQHKLEEEDDFELMLQQRNHPRSQLQEDRLKVKEFLNVSNKEVEREGKKKLQALNIDSEEEDNPEEYQIQVISGTSNTVNVQNALKKLSPATDAKQKTQKGAKLCNSQTRPQSSYIQHQQVVARRTSQSQIMQRKKPANRLKQVQRRERSSDEDEFPLSLSDQASPRVQSEERKAQVTSITVGPAFGSGDALSRKSKSKERVQAKNLNRMVTNTCGVAQHSSLKQNRRHSNTSKKQRYGAQPHQQSVGARLGGAPRSKSRLSNQSNQLKGIKDQGTSQPRQGRKAFDKRQAKSKSPQERRSSSSANKGMPKKRDQSAESASLVRSNQESITPGGRGSQVPLLTQPSFSEHTNTGSKIAIPHNYSFDVSHNARGGRPLLKNSREHSSSITSLQQQVLFNQKLLMQMQLQQSKSRTDNHLSGIGSTTAKSLARKSQTRPQTALGKHGFEGQSLVQQSVTSMDLTKKSQTRGQSFGGVKKSSIGSLATTAGAANSLNKHLQSFDQSRQQQVMQGIMQMVATRNHQPHASLQSFTKSTQKENLMSRASNILQAQQQQQIPKKALNTSAVKRKTIKDFACSVQNQQKSQSRDQVKHHPSATSHYMTNQSGMSRLNRSFFDQNSPLLQKKQGTLHQVGKSGGSHSPPQKKQPAQQIPRQGQKVTNDIKNYVGGMANSRHGIFPSGSIYATTDGRTQTRNKSTGAIGVQPNNKRISKQIHQSFMQHPELQLQQFLMEEQTNLPENNQSFDQAFLTKGSTDLLLRQKQRTPLLEPRAQLPMEIVKGKERQQATRVGQYLRAT